MLQRSTVKVFISTLGVSHEHLEVVNDCDEIYRGDHRKHDELLPTVHGRSSEHDVQRLGKVAEGITLRFSEELHAQDGVNTHDEQDDDEGVGDRKDGLSDGADDLANLVKPTEEAKHTECSEKTHTADGRCTLNGTCKV